MLWWSDGDFDAHTDYILAFTLLEVTRLNAYDKFDVDFIFLMVSWQYVVGSDNITPSAVKYNFEVFNWSIDVSILCHVYLTLHLFDSCSELIFSSTVPFPCC